MKTKNKEQQPEIEQPEIVTQVVADDSQPVLAVSSLAAGYVELKLKSGKGKTVIVPKHTMKFYSDEIWEVVAEGQSKKK